MEPIEQDGLPSPGRQSKARERKGYSWQRITGLPVEVKEELDAIKTGLGFQYRDDVLTYILGEVGAIPASMVRSGLAQIRMEDEDGCTFRSLIPDDLIEVIKEASHFGQVPLAPDKVAAGILMVHREKFRELARRGLMRRLSEEGAAA